MSNTRTGGPGGEQDTSARATAPKQVHREGYEITFYPAAYKERPVITILAPEGKRRTSDFYLSGYVWRELQTKKRAPAAVEQQLKSLFKEFTSNG